MTQEGRVRRRYKSPPVSEAICEFQFGGTKEWDWTIPGLLYQEIREEFPEKRQEKAFEISIAPQMGKVEQSVGSLSKMQFVRQDGSAMVQIGPDLIAVNVLPPYPGWETFEALIRKQFEIYLKVAQPAAFKRIGLRYVNQIVFPAGEIETTDYFHYYPKLPETVEQRHGPFWMRVLHAYSEDRDVMTFQMAHAKPTNKKLTIVLDLDYYLAKPDVVELTRGLDWVAEAHENVEAMFEASITDNTRNLFEETKECQQ
jgi:uncharacterized protein (TIGR04255 family)